MKFLRKLRSYGVMVAKDGGENGAFNAKDVAKKSIRTFLESYKIYETKKFNVIK